MPKKEVAFLEGRLLSNQSEQFEQKVSKNCDWLEKNGSLKKNYVFLH